MYISAAILFFCSLLGGLSVILKPQINKVNFKLILAFSGAFLFATTIVHLLPEAFELTSNKYLAGILVLCGFYFQIFIEFFSEGVEHGHIHIHKPNQLKSISLIMALSIHALLEGMIISHEDAVHQESNNGDILLGLIIHKIPETIALVSVLIASHISKNKTIIILILFSLASPLGVLTSNWLHHSFMSFTGIIMLLVSGNFLYISTTIFFESNPEHKLDNKRVLVLFLGGVLAVSIQYFIH